MQYLIHPLAETIPAMTQDEYETLKASIKTHGFNQAFPVLLWHNMVLDGRHRYTACLELGIDPYCVEWVGTEEQAQQFVFSANVARRSLSPSQRAALVAKVYLSDTNTKTVDELASAAHVSQRQATQAIRVAREEPEAVNEIIAGKETVNSVAAKLPPKPTIVRDKVGNVVVDQDTANAIVGREAFDQWCNTLHSVKRDIVDGAKEPHGRELRVDVIGQKIQEAIEAIRWAMPFAKCPYGTCKKGCKACKGTGWVTRDVWNNIPAEIRGE